MDLIGGLWRQWMFLKLLHIRSHLAKCLLFLGIIIIVLSILLSVLTSGQITSTIKSLTKQVKAVAENETQVIQLKASSELDSLKNVLNEMLSNINSLQQKNFATEYNAIVHDEKTSTLKT